MKTFQRLVVEPSQIRDRHIVLTSQQQHYLNRVLRLGVGDRFIVMDGQGHSWLAALANVDQAQILEPITVQSELPVAITLVAALPKGSGFDEVVRQSTELGVGCIAPVISDRTLLQPSPQKLERWRRIAQEAAEQSERQIVPTILEPAKFIQHLQNSNDTAIKYLCVARGNAPHLIHCLQNSPDSQLPALGRHKALPLPSLPTIQTAAALNQGIDALEQAILEIAQTGKIQAANLDLAINQRQAAALTHAKAALQQVQETIANQLPLDFWTIDLRAAIQALGEILGEDVTESVLDRIFSRFCIGK
jgi:16S rRNA (uracil1498-N3)-methyltransferase